MVRYSFLVGLLHSQLHAGSSRRTDSPLVVLVKFCKLVPGSMTPERATVITDQLPTSAPLLSASNRIFDAICCIQRRRRKLVVSKLHVASGLWECGKLGGVCRGFQGLRETVENHNAEIRARKLREWFSTGFLEPVISTALPRICPIPGVHRHVADALQSLATRRFQGRIRLLPDFPRSSLTLRPPAPSRVAAISIARAACPYSGTGSLPPSLRRPPPQEREPAADSWPRSERCEPPASAASALH